MATSLADTSRPQSTPVARRQRIGDKFVGALVRFESRDRLKKNDAGEMVPMFKPNGKPRQELVVHCLAMPQNTMPCGLGDDISTPTNGEPVRLILKGRAYGDWIEALKTHRDGKDICVGDVVVATVDHAQAYSADGEPKGGQITDQAAADAIPRGTSVGFYGTTTLHLPKDEAWVQRAEAAFNEWKDGTRTSLAGNTGDDIDDEPF